MIIGNLALQGIKGVNKIVFSLLISSSIIRVAIIPGTLHPVPIINGIKLLPLNPNLEKNLSNIFYFISIKIYKYFI